MNFSKFHYSFNMEVRQKNQMLKFEAGIEYNTLVWINFEFTRCDGGIEMISGLPNSTNSFFIQHFHFGRFSIAGKPPTMMKHFSSVCVQYRTRHSVCQIKRMTVISRLNSTSAVIAYDMTKAKYTTYKKKTKREWETPKNTYNIVHVILS